MKKTKLKEVVKCPADIERLRQMLRYEPETGRFFWKVSRTNSTPAGSEAGHTSGRYLLVGVLGCVELAHRLAWLMHYGRWPREHLDHINGDCFDNRIANLRECSHRQNMANRKRPNNGTSGFKGVSYHRGSRKWRACIVSGGKHYSLGLYHSPEEAHAAYMAKSRELNGEFARSA